MNDSPDPEAKEHSPEETVWQYLGYRIRPSEFVTAMVHFYRGEIARSNTWRTRLDTTTNWSVITTAAVLTFAFTAVDRPHVVILLSMLLIWLFLISEARRYRYYELWALRVRLMETEFFAAMLGPGGTPDSDWANRLIASLTAPEFPVSYWEALGRRLRRNYIWLFLILGLAWGLKLLLYPTVTHTFESFVEHAAVGPIHGLVILSAMGVFFVALFLIAFFTAGLRASPGEVLSRREILGGPSELIQNLARVASEIPYLGKRNHLAIVITERPDQVGEKLLAVLKRGVTSVSGSGMYSKQDRAVLFCAVATSEIERLKSVIHSADEKAFVVVNRTEEVLGGGFSELKPRWRRWSRKPNA
ncbi:MAG: DUF2270 domain-containing protein, partial [Acidobacteriota bacterium]